MQAGLEDVDGRELSGRPTGTGRYLRNLLRVWSTGEKGTLFVYFDGEAYVGAGVAINSALLAKIHTMEWTPAVIAVPLRSTKGPVTLVDRPTMIRYVLEAPVPKQ